MKEKLTTIWKKCIRNQYAVIALIIVVYPLGLYCMWKGGHFSKTVRWVVTIVWITWQLNLLMESSNQGDDGPYCSKTFQSGNCVYYRDDECNVIGRSCQ